MKLIFSLQSCHPVSPHPVSPHPVSSHPCSYIMRPGAQKPKTLVGTEGQMHKKVRMFFDQIALGFGTHPVDNMAVVEWYVGFPCRQIISIVPPVGSNPIGQRLTHKKRRDSSYYPIIHHPCRHGENIQTPYR